ncbi:TetR/AcrR family transcriptional regulator [Phytobacter palmae]|uniref:TetR/AcrR family transcriptional regulator n=1 Tax=Phytobacter palmae TaxID=1855371 RepID=A0ABU9VBC5_9ENTR
MGRSREFDVGKALDAALGVFWSKGYEGASYSDLTKATGVERPALYSAFGNKEALFLRALERYYDHYLDFFPAALAQPTAKAVVAFILRAAADLHTRYPEHTGCLGINGALACSDDAKPVQKALIEARENGEIQLRQRFEQAKVQGDLPQDADCEALAAYVCAVLHGMAIQAKAGFSRERLDAISSQVLAGWPT